MSEGGGFLGLEVIGASERLPLTKEQLSEVEEVEITVQEDENMMVSIIMKQEGEQTSLNLPVTDFNSQPA